MSKLSECRDRRLYFKWRAKCAMGERGNLLRFIGATFVMLAVLEAFLYFFETFCFFIVGEDMPAALLIAELVIAFVIIAPIFMGLLRMAHQMSCGRKTELADILWAYNSKRIRDAYLIALRTFAGFCALFCLSFAFGRMVAYATEGIYAEFFSIEALLFTFAVMPFLSGAFTGAFVLPTAYFETDDLEKAIVLSKKNISGQAFEISAFNVSFIPLLLVSMLTFGIMIFVYFLPLYMLASQLCASYFVGCCTPEYYRK